MVALRIFSSPRRLAAFGLIAIVAVTGYGYAASNAVPTSLAGDGAGTVSGFAVTDIHYNLDTSNPQNLTSLTFTVAPAVPAGGAVRASLDNGVSWLAAGACSITGGTSVTCTTSNPVTGVTTLRVVAAQ
jgi:hypothetical protein